MSQTEARPRTLNRRVLSYPEKKQINQILEAFYPGRENLDRKSDSHQPRNWFATDEHTLESGAILYVKKLAGHYLDGQPSFYWWITDPAADANA